MHTIVIALVTLLLAAPALACDDRTERLMKDQVRAQQEQARSLERQERLMRDRNRMIDRSIRNKD